MKLNISGRKQQGWSRTSLLMVVFTVAVVSTTVMKLFPVYVDHNFVVTVTRSVLENSNVSVMSQPEFRREISRSLRINSVSEVSSEAVTLLRNGPETSARIRYERRVPLIYNVDFMVSFDERVD